MTEDGTGEGNPGEPSGAGAAGGQAGRAPGGKPEESAEEKAGDKKKKAKKEEKQPGPAAPLAKEEAPVEALPEGLPGSVAAEGAEEPPENPSGDGKKADESKPSAEDRPPAPVGKDAPPGGKPAEDQPRGKGKAEAPGGDEKADDARPSDEGNSPKEGKAPLTGGKADKSKPPPPAGKAAKPAGDVALPEESLDELQAHKEEVEALLSSIEDAYREATLPDATYKEVKAKNVKRLEDINSRMEMARKHGHAAAAPSAPAPAETAPAAAAAPAAEDAPRAALGKPPAAKPPAAGAAGGPYSMQDMQAGIQQRFREALEDVSKGVTDKRVQEIQKRVDEMSSKITMMEENTAKIPGFEKSMLTIKTEVEKAKALVESAGQTKNVLDEKISGVNESLAELRSMVYQRESSFKEQEVTVSKLKEIISSVDTARILREFTRRDQESKDLSTRIERLERSTKTMTETMTRIKALMVEVGSLENIIKASKHVGEKLEKIEDIWGRMKSTSERFDKAYIEMRKNLDEFAAYKIKQDKIDKMSTEMITNFEDLSRRLSEYTMKKDFEDVKSVMSRLRDDVKELKTPAEPPEVKALRDEAMEIKELLKSLEENFKSGTMDQQEYELTKKRNQDKLKKLEKSLAGYGKGAAPALAAPGTVKVPGGLKPGSHKRVMMLAKLRQSYESGMISKKAYDKSRQMLIGK